MPRRTDTDTSPADIRPFHLEISQADLDDLHTRLANTRWPDQPGGTGWERGVPVDYLRDLVAHWAGGFDWRAQEERLNAIPQFVTTIDGQDIHFLHVRSRHEGSLPLLMTHGWPSSSVEFLRVLEPLADPTASGGDASDAFDLVVRRCPATGCRRPWPVPGGAT